MAQQLNLFISYHQRINIRVIILNDDMQTLGEVLICSKLLPSYDFIFVGRISLNRWIPTY